MLFCCFFFLMMPSVSCSWRFDNDIFSDACKIFFFVHEIQFITWISSPLSIDHFVRQQSRSMRFFKRKEFSRYKKKLRWFRECFWLHAQVMCNIILCVWGNQVDVTTKMEPFLSDIYHNLWLYPFHQFQLLPSIRLSSRNDCTSISCRISMLFFCFVVTFIHFNLHVRIYFFTRYYIEAPVFVYKFDLLIWMSFMSINLSGNFFIGIHTKYTQKNQAKKTILSFSLCWCSG